MVIPRLRTPIVLVHGLLGFDRLQMGGWVLADYFPGIPKALRAAGNRVLVASLSPTAGIADRARQLKDLLNRESPGEPVHLIGHSMGGLDARYMISRLGMAGRVLSLTTLGTPHRGTSFADWGLRRFAGLVCPVLNFFGVPHGAFADLTVSCCKKFNAEVLDAPGVRYFSVAGRFQTSWTTPEWQLPACLVQRQEGPNDGIVSVASATYGESCDVWECDHLNLVNWRHPFKSACNRIPDYARLVGRLADEGF
jgi:triacylglycerol lipase